MQKVEHLFQIVRTPISTAAFRLTLWLLYSFNLISPFLSLFLSHWHFDLSGFTLKGEHRPLIGCEPDNSHPTRGTWQYGGGVSIKQVMGYENDKTNASSAETQVCLKWNRKRLPGCLILAFESESAQVGTFFFRFCTLKLSQ